MAASEIDRVVEKLAKDVEAAVHALYRGEVRQMTAKARTSAIVKEARAALDKLIAADAPSGERPSAGPASARPSAAAPVAMGAAVGWTREEGEAVMRCINAWLPVGPPSGMSPDAKCIAAARELAPTWAQRERAREAVRRVSAS